MFLLCYAKENRSGILPDKIMYVNTTKTLSGSCDIAKSDWTTVVCPKLNFANKILFVVAARLTRTALSCIWFRTLASFCKRNGYLWSCGSEVIFERVLLNRVRDFERSKFTIGHNLSLWVPNQCAPQLPWRATHCTRYIVSFFLMEMWWHAHFADERYFIFLFICHVHVLIIEYLVKN